MNWINAKDRLPEDGKSYLIFVPKENYNDLEDFIYVAYRTHDIWIIDGKDFYYDHAIHGVTHYMELNDIPKPEMK